LNFGDFDDWDFDDADKEVEEAADAPGPEKE